MIIEIILAFTIACLLPIVLQAACKPKKYNIKEIEKRYNSW